MATPTNDSHGLRQLNKIAQLHFFLIAQEQIGEQIGGDARKFYFKVQEEKNEWFIVNGLDTLLAQTEHETALYFLLAYNLPKSHQDKLGYQYFEITKDALSSVNEQPGVREAIFIARNITSPPRTRKRK